MGGPMKSFLAALGFVEKIILPVAALALPFIPGVPAVAIGIFKLLPGLIGAMEEAIPESGKGPLKKEGVLNASKAILDGVDKVATGGAAQTYDKLQPVLEKFIDAIVTGANNFRPDIISSSYDGPPRPGIDT